MLKSFPILLSIFFVSNLFLQAEPPISTPSENSETVLHIDSESLVKAPAEPFNAFTGKITKNKVRLRLHPSLEGQIVKELNQGDMLIVVDAIDDFFAVQPPADLKTYVFRTYVLDNVVEGSNVNVRLEPDVDGLIVGKLNAGERVNGTISPLNSKWLEIPAPASARLYIAKDYVEKIGDASLMAKIEKRRDEVNLLLNTSYLIGQKEMQKAFPEINIEGVNANFNKIINSFPDFPSQVSRARELIASFQDMYLQKKLAYLEAKAKMAEEGWQSKSSQLNEKMKSQQQRLTKLEQQIKKTETSSGSDSSSPSEMTNKMAAWLPAEKMIYEAWKMQNSGKSEEQFYEEQSLQAVTFRGIIEPYTRVVKNQPGDYILVNQTTNLPVAYLYSTKINLQDKVGQTALIHAIPRPNNNFAFPAYFVLSME